MKALFVASCALTSALVFAAPDPAYVPASADLVVVADQLDQTAPADKVAIQKLKDAGRYTDTQLSDLAKINPNLPALFKALLGISDDCQSMTATSITLSVCFPETINDEGRAINAGVYAVIENPKIDLPAFTTSMKEMAKEKPGITFTEAEGWTIVRDEADLEGNLPFMGYRAVPGGALLAISDKADIAKALADKTAPSIAGSSANPLTAAFTAPAGAEGSTLIATLKSVQDLANRYITDEADKAKVAQMYPVAFKTSTLTFSTYTKGNDYFITLNAATNDEATAQEVSEMFIAGKVAALQFVRSVGVLPPDGAIEKLISAAKISTEGSTAKLSITISVEDAIALGDEFQTLATMMSMMMGPGAITSPADDPDLEWPEEDEDDLNWIDDEEE